MWVLALVAAYSAAVHLALAYRLPALALALLLALSAAALAAPLRRGRPVAWLTLLALGGAGLALLYLQRGALLLYAPPLFYTLGGLLLFGRTLRPGHTPLVTRIAGAMGDELDAHRRAYTRRVTQGWTLLFLAMTVELIVLATYASPALWSLFANVINYLILGAAFLVEFALRKRHFPDAGGFAGFVRGLRRVDLRRLEQEGRP